MTALSADTVPPTNSRLNGFLASRAQGDTPWLLATLCLIIPLLPSYVVPFGNRALSPALMISSVLLGLVILGFIVGRRDAQVATVMPGVIIVLVYLALALVAYISGASGSAAEPNRNLPFTILLGTLGIALYAMTRITNTSQRSLVLGTLAVGLTYLCMVGVLQNYMDVDLRLLFQPPGFLEARQMSQAINVPTLQRFDAKRSFGTSDHAAEFSVLAAVAVPLTIHFARYATMQVTRFLAAVGTGIALIGVLAGVSRSGVVALAGALLIYIWAFKVRTLLLGSIASAVLLIGMAVVIGPAAIVRSAQALWRAITEGASFEDPSVVARVERYAAISQVFQDHPFLGLGVGRFPPNIDVLDNQWLKALVEGGLVGVVAMAVLAIGGLVGIAAALRVAHTPRERDQAYMTGAIFTGILATSFTLDLFLFAQATLVLFLAFGLLWSNYKVPISKSQSLDDVSLNASSRPL